MRITAGRSFCFSYLVALTTLYAAGYPLGLSTRMTAVAGTSFTGPVSHSWVKFTLIAQYLLLLNSLRGVVKQGVLGYVRCA